MPTLLNTAAQQVGSQGVGVVRIVQPSTSSESREGTIPYMIAQEGGIDLVIDGLADGTSGFAALLRDWARHLTKLGVRVHIPPHRISEYPEIVGMHNIKVNNPIELTIIPGGGFPSKPTNKYQIGYTLFETNEFPTYFADTAKNINALWTGSNFCAERFAKAGVPKNKIEIFPCGVDTELFSPYVPPLMKNDKKFVFGNICGWSERKGISILLNAFLKEFDRTDNVSLAIFGGWYAKENALREVNEAKAGIGKANFPEIILDWNNRSDWEMPGLYTSLNALCYPSKGEGYCKPIVEALSCETPVIATDAPPINEVVTVSVGYPIKVSHIGPEPRADWIHDLYKGANFFHPSEEHCRSIMREVFTHPEEAKARAVKGREFIKKKHDTASIMEDVAKRLMEIKIGEGV